MLGRYKKAIEARAEALARLAAATGVSPNAITAAGLLLGLAGLYALYTLRSTPLFIAGVAAMSLMDMLDGLVARHTGRSSRFGAFLDSTVDRAEDAVIAAGLMYAGILSPGLAILLLTGMFLISYTRARAEGLGLSMSGVGIAERPERLILAMLSLLASLASMEAARIIAYGLTGLVYVTVAERVVYAYRKLR